MQKVSDAPLKKCPHCGKPQLQRLMSAPVFRLKGGGWYETDFKSDQDNKRNLADRPEAEAPKEDKKETTEAASKDAARGARCGQSRRRKPPRSRPRRPAGGAHEARRAARASRRAVAVRRRSPRRRRRAKRPARAAVKRSAAKPARRR